MPSFVPLIILGSAVLFAGAGVGLIVAGQTMMGVILIAVGLCDLITVPLLRGRIGGAAKPAETENPETENPYAQED